MKTISTIIFLWLVLAFTACHKETKDLSPIPEYQTAIETKFATLDWEKAGFVASGSIANTTGKTGWVQYYILGPDKRAIYYYSGTGAVAFNEYETKKYDALGQDTFAGLSNDYKLGKPVDDSKPCGYGCSFVQFESGIIIAPYSIVLGNSYVFGYTVAVYGSVYAKYKNLGLWDGPLGYPFSDTAVSSNSNGTLRVNPFAKTDKDYNAGGNFIYYSPSSGTQALWGAVCKAYRTTPGFTWLGYPTSSCDPAKVDNAQKVSFANGHMEMNGNCAVFYSKINGKVTSSGTVSNGAYPCY